MITPETPRFAGKGSKQRPTDYKKFSAHWDSIDWRRKPTPNSSVSASKLKIVDLICEGGPHGLVDKESIYLEEKTPLSEEKIDLSETKKDLTETKG